MLTYKYNVPRSCILIDLKTEIVKEKNQMITGRWYHSVCHINNFIYAIGGVDTKDYAVSSCERYSILDNKWRKLRKSADFDDFTRNISVIVTQKRYMHTFGGMNDEGWFPDMEIIRTFDSLKPLSGWRILHLETTRLVCGYYYGLFALDTSSPSILVFGGETDEHCILRVSQFYPTYKTLLPFS